MLQAGARARIVLIGQAPGSKVHASGVPWADDSGQRLRSWLGVDDATFYDGDRFALLPMGFCYPGKGRSGDLPPRPECAPLWHPPLLAALPAERLVLLVGLHAQKHYLGRRRASTLTQTVRAWRDYLDDGWFPLPHPAWRVVRWIRTNPWFEAEVLPALRARVAASIAPLEEPAGRPG